jgi:hypothetical protein
MDGITFGRNLIKQLGDWVNALAAPIMPPRVVLEGEEYLRLEFREHLPHTAMIGKAIRAASGIGAALALADLGYIVECGSILRMVSDFCSEIDSIGQALNGGGELPAAVQTFVDQYFAKRMMTADQFPNEKRPRYVSRDELAKSELYGAKGEGRARHEQIRYTRQYLNYVYDGFVHCTYASTMELCDPRTWHFMVDGHQDASKREEYVEAVMLKLHEVVVAIEITAAMTAHATVFNAAREARHAMDASQPWNTLGGLRGRNR